MSTKFIINTALDNEFDLTIKQTGTTLPMEIVAGVTTLESSIPHSTEYVPATSGSSEVKEVVKRYYIHNIRDLIVDTTYTITVEGVDVSLANTGYQTSSEYLEALVSKINSDAGVTITATLYSADTILLTGLTFDQEYTASCTSDRFMVVNSVVGTVGLIAIPSIRGVLEKYSITLGAVPNTAYLVPAEYDENGDLVAAEYVAYNTVSYGVWVNGVEISIQHTSDPEDADYHHENVIDFLRELKVGLDDNADVDVFIDSNTMYLTCTILDTDNSINVDDALTIAELSKYVAEQEGRSYIAPRESMPVVEPVPGNYYISEYYLATNVDETLDITELVANVNGTTTNVEIRPEVEVGTVYKDGIEVEVTDGWYDLGNLADEVITITPKLNEDKLPDTLPEIAVYVKVTISDTSDSFVAHLIDLSTGTTISTQTAEVIDATAGKIRLVYAKDDADVLGLKADNRGAAVDRYYLKPVGKILIECDTFNNGQFVATVPEVYVD